MKKLLLKKISRGEIKLAEDLLSIVEVNLIKDALHHVVRNKNVDLLKLLLSKGIDVNSKDSEGNTALHIAAEKCSTQLEEILVSNNADLTSVNNFGHTPLFLAEETFRKGRKKFVKILLRKGRRLSGKNYKHYKSYYRLCEKIIRGSVYSYKKFLRNQDLDVDFTQINGVESPLMFAVLKGRFDIVKNLVDAGANVNFRKNGKGESALHLAAKYNQIEIMSFLLESGADPNCTISDAYLWTPLHYAVGNPGRMPAEMLLNRGALPNLSNVTLPYLSALHEAVAAGNVFCVELLLNHNADIDHRDKMGMTALLQACEYSQAEVIELLLRNKADPNIADNEGRTALLVACSSDEDYVVERLVQQGADLDVRDNNGKMILHYAGWSKKNIDYLFAHDPGLNINSLDNNFLIPLRQATSCSAFWTFLCYGADLNLGTTSDGQEFSKIFANFQDLESDANEVCPIYVLLEKLKLLGYRVQRQLDEIFFQDPTFCPIHQIETDYGLDMENFEAEIQIMKNSVVSNYPRTTLYDILFVKQHRASKLSQNQWFRSMYLENEEDFALSFPHFGFILNLNIRRGARRNQLMNMAQNSLEIMICNYQISIFRDQILKYLENSVLKNLSKACKFVNVEPS